MKIERFEDIIAWQKAKVLTVRIYKLFAQSRDFGIKDQIQRASVSIMNNIAEGFERKSNNEFKQLTGWQKSLTNKYGLDHRLVTGQSQAQVMLTFAQVETFFHAHIPRPSSWTIAPSGSDRIATGI